MGIVLRNHLIAAVHLLQHQLWGQDLGNRLGVANAYIVTPKDIERYYVTPRTFGILADFTF